MLENNFILAGNGPYKNHGCEAIIRGTVKIINEYYYNSKFITANYYDYDTHIQQKRTEENNQIEHVKLLFPIGHNVEWFKSKIYKLFYSKNMKNFRCKELNNYINGAKAVLAVGGDNYSLDYANLDWFTDIDDYAIENNKPIIIWGASVGPFSKDKASELYMSEHLKKVTAIFARESETINYLNSIGIKDNVYRVCDPAFLLDKKKPEHYDIKIEEGSVGINISPLMVNFVSNSNHSEFIKLAVKIIEKIIITTGRKVYLIPHVVINGNSDYEIMTIIYNNIDEKLKEKIEVISDKLNASEYKWIISKMEVFFGARTHATIAALSTLVPTLSFVYSIKSVGINKDLFGSDEYCIYPEQFKEDILVEKIQYLIDNKEKIKEHLQVRVEEAIKLALKSGEYLHNIIG